MQNDAAGNSIEEKTRRGINPLIWVLLAVVVGCLGLAAGMFLALSVNSSPPEVAPTREATVNASSASLAPPENTLNGSPSAPLLSGVSVTEDARGATLGNVHVQASDTRCDVTRVVEWSRPGGGAYCVIALTLVSRTAMGTTLEAGKQYVYGLPPLKGAPSGYAGSFFMDENKQPVASLTLDAGQTRYVYLVVDIQQGFRASKLYPSESNG